MPKGPAAGPLPSRPPSGPGRICRDGVCAEAAGGCSATRCRRRLHRFKVVQLVEQCRRACLSHRQAPHGGQGALHVAVDERVLGDGCQCAAKRSLDLYFSGYRRPVRQRQSLSQQQRCRCGCRRELPERASNEWFRNQWPDGFETIVIDGLIARQRPARLTEAALITNGAPNWPLRRYDELPHSPLRRRRR